MTRQNRIHILVRKEEQFLKANVRNNNRIAYSSTPHYTRKFYKAWHKRFKTEIFKAWRDV